MNKTPLCVVFFFALILIACSDKVKVDDLRRFVATEDYPKDVFLDTVANKRAFVIVAHDDDDCAMSGTIAKLTAAGWVIEQLSLQSHVNPSTQKNPADIICQGNDLLLSDGHYRLGADTIKYPYLPVPYSTINAQFLYDKVASAIKQKIESFRPSVVFTLDNVKGGYGHPDHIFISQLTKDLFDRGEIKIQKIYQSVYTDHMETEIVDKWLGEKMKQWGYPDASKMANELYGIAGMPEPTVHVNICDVAVTKMRYLRAYEEDVKKNLRKFIPYYEEFDAATYFKVFDKEFFRIIDKPENSSSKKIK
jgi:LmbE family N-acetylglucosaminyl deacetylase